MSKKKKIVVLSVCICLALVVMGGTLAWYMREDAKRAQTEAATVMAPYYLYLLNPDDEHSLEFAVGNLHPGETKQAVICVSNKRPVDYEGDENVMAELAKDSEFGYDLMLVHTENLAVDYTIYPLTKFDIEKNVPLPPGSIIVDDNENTKGKYYWMKGKNKKKKEITLDEEDITDDMRERARIVEAEGDPLPVNAGTYCLYSRDSEGKAMELAYHVDENGEGQYEFDYYLIEISWQDIKDFDSYRKETDMVFVVVNAKQPRPILENK